MVVLNLNHALGLALCLGLAILSFWFGLLTGLLVTYLLVIAAIANYYRYLRQSRWLAGQSAAEEQPPVPAGQSSPPRPGSPA
jgi:hypothetical protein